MSEPASGSDAFALKTRAEKVGDDYIINGSKMWITNSYEAEIFLIFANVRSFGRYNSIEMNSVLQVDPGKGYKGITCFAATKDMGIQVAKKEQKLGIRASSTCTLNFDDLKVPAANIIGGVGQGYKVIQIPVYIRCDLNIHSPSLDCHRVSQRRPHWHCRSDDWFGSRRLRQGRTLHIPTGTVRPTRWTFPGNAVPNC